MKTNSSLKSGSLTMKIMIFILLVGVFVSGCSYSNNLLSIEDKDRNSQEFRGIVDVINQPGNTNVLFIHGMGGYWSNGGEIDPCHVINDVRGAFNLEPATFSFPQWHCDNTFSTSGKTVHLRSMHWSDITFTRKNSLQIIDSDPTFYENRAKITSLIKENLINNGFSDALMYTGVFQQDIINRVIESYEYINQINPNSKTVIVTFSLGSAILIDSLKELEKINKADVLKKKIEMVYMLANQVPLIKTGTQSILTQNNKLLSKDTLYANLTPYFSDYSNKKVNSEIKVVAFSDPNDLLSYPLDEKNMGELKFQYVNVVISIADKTYFVPFYKDKTSVVNYLKAHTGYIYNNSVKELLLRGNHINLAR